MIRIALVEDEESYVATLREFLARYERERGERLQITVFSDGDEIALNYKSEYDVILMDIEMRFMDGMTAAEEIRRVDPEVVIIFITNSPQYAIKGYAVDALDYVLKPLTYFAFSQRIDRALERLGNREQRYMMINIKGGSRKLDVSRVWFIEVRDHDHIYHTGGGLITPTGTMREAEKALEGCAFFRCNKGYLVNLEHVDAIREDNAVVHGETVQVSRARKKAFLDALNNYLGEVSK